MVCFDDLNNDMLNLIIRLVPLNTTKYLNKRFYAMHNKNYYKYMTEGTIYHYDKYSEKYVNMKIKGIKAVNDEKNGSMILNFDGDLHIIKDNDSILMAKNVVDIDTNTYITSNKWYYINNKHESIFIMESSDPFLNVRYYDQKLFATTKDTIYSTDWEDLDDEHFFENNPDFKMTVIKKHYNKIIKVCITGPIMVLVDNNRCEILDFDLTLRAVAENVAEIYSGVIKKGHYYSIIDPFSFERHPDSDDCGIFKFNKDNEYIAEKLDVNHIGSSLERYSPWIVVDNNIYSLEYDETTGNFHKNLIYTSDYDIIKISGKWRGQYIVCHQ
jgi:hypothetical protein